MYSGMADVAAVTGDEAMRAAGKRIWDYLITSKLYLTGGIGASGSGEAFGQPYELPNMTAYNETCASVGMDFWNHRLFLLEGDAKYMDVMERTLFNGLVSGVSLDGKTFFYPNPLESNGQHARQEWFGVACCPGNITRFMPSVPGYLYATRGDAVYVNLFAQGTADVDLPGGAVTIDAGDALPVGRRVKMHDRAAAGATVRGATSASRAGRATNRCRAISIAFLDKAPRRDAVRQRQQRSDDARQRLRDDRSHVDARRHRSCSTLPMPVRRVVSNDQVIANRDRVALQRGPIVYAAEWPDNPNGKVRNIVLPDRQRADLRVPRRSAERRAGDPRPRRWGSPSTRRAACSGPSSRSWRFRTPRGRIAAAVRWRCGSRASMPPRGRRRSRRSRRPSTIAASPLPNGRGKNPRNIIDGDEPANSADPSAYFDWWPVQGSKSEWIEITFAQAVGGVRQRGVLVRRHRSRRRARARLVAAPLQDRRPVAPVQAMQAYGVERERLECGPVHAGHHQRRSESRS